METDSDGARSSPSDLDDRPPDEVRELIGVYHATGTALGELSYWIKARLGRGHCQLCDITHGSLREKSEWRSCRASLSVPFATVHLDERSPQLARATDGRTPCVVAVTGHGIHVLLDAADLERCEGSPARLVDAVDAAIGRRGLVLP